jgi:hypothetical protein
VQRRRSFTEAVERWSNDARSLGRLSYCTVPLHPPSLPMKRDDARIVNLIPCVLYVSLHCSMPGTLQLHFSPSQTPPTCLSCSVAKRSKPRCLKKWKIKLSPSTQSQRFDCLRKPVLSGVKPRLSPNVCGHSLYFFQAIEVAWTCMNGPL